MDSQATFLLIGFVGGVAAAIIGATGQAILSYWLGGRKERSRLRRQHYEAALRYHRTGESLRLFDLAGRDLTQVNLSNADLYGANLSKVGLRAASLTGANLAGANLQEALAMHANLQGATLTLANLKQADLDGARLEFADLSGANLQGTNLKDAHLARATMDDSTVMPEGWEEVVASRPEDAWVP